LRSSAFLHAYESPVGSYSGFKRYINETLVGTLFTSENPYSVLFGHAATTIVSFGLVPIIYLLLSCRILYTLIFRLKRVGLANKTMVAVLSIDFSTTALLTVALALDGGGIGGYFPPEIKNLEYFHFSATDMMMFILIANLWYNLSMKWSRSKVSRWSQVFVSSAAVIACSSEILLSFFAATLPNDGKQFLVLVSYIGSGFLILRMIVSLSMFKIISDALRKIENSIVESKSGSQYTQDASLMQQNLVRRMAKSLRQGNLFSLVYIISVAVLANLTSSPPWVFLISLQMTFLSKAGMVYSRCSICSFPDGNKHKIMVSAKQNTCVISTKN